jgi:hypothetical protein
MQKRVAGTSLKVPARFSPGYFVTQHKDGVETMMRSVQFCPHCGESLLHPNSLLNHFSVADDEAYFCWCSKCRWRGEIVEVTRVTAPALESE